tara:strand:- start:393 stop:1049 length:657 start_codon:yes stop_codon:yes gene_type:complete
MNGKLKTPDQIIASLAINHPILIVDADEVLLQFVKRLETYFPTKGYELRLESFQLHGNIYETKTNTASSQESVKKLISTFFDECVDDIPPVNGAVQALSELSNHFQILILSNVPERCRIRRQQSLCDLGMAFPVIANKGAKGPFVKRIVEQTNAQHSVFIDDLPPHHTSVANHSPGTQRIHFIADKRLRDFMPKAPDAHQRFDSWCEIKTALLETARS